MRNACIYSPDFYFKFIQYALACKYAHKYDETIKEGIDDTRNDRSITNEYYRTFK
ncbi:hypothetical protein MACH08_29970 [Oceanobacillus kimchii]|uniref:Uncharacterized protein n=1 Tax=Oceanobacillus kimchii TaxID=746691 RepID=A0ABQ5TNM7_9BACI|nr:hypothetical protein MACH08_29970 [Oceanobacillus kimchii]